MTRQELKQREERLNLLEKDMMASVSKLTVNIKKNEPINMDALMVLLMAMMETQSLVNHVCMSTAKKSLMADDIVKNLTTTSGNVVDLLAEDLDKKIGSVVNSKFNGVKTVIESFSENVIEKFDTYQTTNDNKLKQSIDKVFKIIKGNEVQIKKVILKFSLNFGIAILGGLVAIQLYQNILFRYL